MILGVDVGLTASKAVVFNHSGVVVASASRPTRNMDTAPGWSERDPAEFWNDVAAVIREAVAGYATDIVGVGIAAHGDGLWLVDEHLQAVRRGITSLDSRASSEAAQVQDCLGAEGLSRLGKIPWASHPSALLRWVREHEPGVLDRTAWALSTKDFLQLQLTGIVVTDLTDAGTAFADISTQAVVPEVLEMQGLSGLHRLVPPVLLPDDVVGGVSAAASASTGLRPGTPVVAGLHDTAAAALGCGAGTPGDVSLLSGTFSINQQVLEHCEVSPDWVLNSFVRPGLWIRDSSSPASSSNLAWFLREICPDVANHVGDNAGALLKHFEFDSEDLTVRTDRPFFVPHLNGSLNDSRHSGGFLGLRPSHTRRDLLFSVVESLAFNHRFHLAMMGLKDVPVVHVAGGISRNAWWQQLLSDVVASAVSAPRVSENGALGVAVVAGSGVGVFAGIDDGVARVASAGASVSPSSDRSVSYFDHRYGRYVELLQALRGWWEA